MKTIKIKKEYKNIEELHNSEEYKKMWEGFEIREVKDYSNNKVIKSFICEDGNIYTIRRIISGKEDGLQILKRLSSISCVNNVPFKIGYLERKKIYINTEDSYSRSKEAREYFAKFHKECLISQRFVTTENFR